MLRCKSRRCAADVINYGQLATDPESLKKVNAPVLGLFGGQDRGITPDDVVGSSRRR